MPSMQEHTSHQVDKNDLSVGGDTPKLHAERVAYEHQTGPVFAFADDYPQWFREQYLEYVSDVRQVRFVSLDGGKRYKAIIPFLFTHAIIVGSTDNVHSYEDRWCYESFELANAAFDKWDGVGEPEGWHRHPNTGRRRPSGNSAGEYVNP